MAKVYAKQLSLFEFVATIDKFSEIYIFLFVDQVVVAL